MAKLCFFFSFLILLLYFRGANASEDKNVFEARRELEAALKQKEAASTYSALITLERLAGNEAAALEYWKKCGKRCERELPKGEWKANQRWACKQNRSFCTQK